MTRRRWAVAMVAVLALALSACTGLPTGGGVNEGLAGGGDVDPPDISLIPDRPQAGATPEQIVDGFLRAGSGVADDWARAQEFLAPQFRGEWDPNAGVTIDVLGSRETRLLDDDTVSVLVSQVARVDEKGSYERVEEGPTTLTFELAQQDDGEWRIAEAPDGIVLDRSLFTSIFNDYSLAYFDTTWNYLVPDVRWFPRSRVASRIVAALVNRPKSEWLAASVRSAFPEGVSAVPSVTVAAGGVATVGLTEDALALDQETRDRMQTQLKESLRTANITQVEMVVGTTVLSAEPVPVRRTAVSGPALVKTEAGFGFLSGDELLPIPGLSGTIADVDATAVQVTGDRDLAAVQRTDGSVWRVPAGGEASLVDDRPRLVEPSVDPFGIIWSVPRDTPHAVRAQLPDGTVVDVTEAWPETTEISAMAMSRDGARIAGLVTAGGRTAVWVSGVLRGDAGVPTGLGAPIVLGIAGDDGRALAWLDETTLGALAGGGETASVLTQPVGGPGTSVTAPSEAVSIATGSTLASTRLRGADGFLYTRRGPNWQESGAGVLVLATQQGTPE
ncbi:LpqB family beta-propeller domain-containing protein [Microbacterium sp. NPDC055910]|uniref:LpqB family beta-propeller domain-containing protein n=1 Tax=Microbacterium sp. NPDC055910 TaxID=3345659 RepID=UPI0035D5B707